MALEKSDSVVPPLSILFEDEWMVAVNKPAGHLVHPTEQPAKDDAVAMKILRDQIGKRVYVIHRLDRPTSGVLLFATDKEIARQLHAALKQQEFEKTYLAVVDGHPIQDQWICNEPIQEHKDSTEKPAETEFRVVDKLDHGLSLIEAKPKTGRFHQIRRHLLHSGFPIVGDYRYSGIERSDELGSRLGTGTRMLLQAKSLQFRHPATGRWVDIEAPTDPLIRKVCHHDATD